MVRKLIRASLFAALGSMAMILSFGAVSTAQDKKDQKDKKDDKAKIMDIDEVMDKAHDKKTGYVAKLKTAVKGEKWEDAEKLAMSLTTAASDLGMNKPPRGEAKSWEALTKKYTENVKAVADGVEKKDAAATNKALGAIGMSCGGCHKVHQPKN